MIGLVLLYFVGKAFYDLAAIHEKNRWGYAVLGVGSYYGGLFLGGILLGVFAELGLMSIDGFSDTVLGFMALPLGVLTCWGTYALLRSQWSKPQKKIDSDEVLDGDLFNQNR